MKKIYLLIAFLAIANVGRAQTICDSCCAESFPYTFCSALGNSQFVQCSSNPNADGNPAKSFIPSCVIVDPMRPEGLWQPKGPPPQPAGLLSNEVLNNDADEEAGAATQQSGDADLFNQTPSQPPVPPVEPTEPENTCGDDPFPDGLTPPTRESVFARYLELYVLRDGWPVPPWHRPYDRNESYWSDNPDAYDAACEQFSLDSENFINGDPESKIDETGLDEFTISVINWYAAEDDVWLNQELTTEEIDFDDDETEESNWITCESTYSTDSAEYPAKLAKYEGAALQYTADSLARVANVNSYTQVFNDVQAQTDAQLALNNWLNLCTPPITPCPLGLHAQPCCIHVVMEDNPDFFSSPLNDLAETDLPQCRESTCPNRYILVNITDGFMSANRDANIDTGAAPSQYKLHPVSRTQFYTGHSTTDTAAEGYSAISFFQAMEHEIGHFLGLNHPEDTVPGGHRCHNCYTSNPFNASNSTGYRTVMAQGNNLPNWASDTALTLTGEDECQFQKLYCNACGGGSGTAPCAYDDGVSTSEPDDFKAEIYPNPATGTCQLQYEVSDRAFVQVAIYNELGTLIKMVSSGFEVEGKQSISLSTESLPSGNYVCRVRVGDRVSYINLVIKK